MDPDYLAADNRFFFERELAWMLRTEKYKAEMLAACVRPFGSGERTIVSFPGDRNQEHHLHILNDEMRYLHEREVNYQTVSAKLPCAKKDRLYERYELELDSGRLTFSIAEYVLVAGRSQLPVNPLKELNITLLTQVFRLEECPLSRVVVLSVVPAVFIPRSPSH